MKNNFEKTSLKLIASGGPAERGLAILADERSLQSSQNTITQAEHTVSNIEKDVPVSQNKER